VPMLLRVSSMYWIRLANVGSSPAPSSGIVMSNSSSNSIKADVSSDQPEVVTKERFPCSPGPFATPYARSPTLNHALFQDPGEL